MLKNYSNVEFLQSSETRLSNLKITYTSKVGYVNSCITSEANHDKVVSLIATRKLLLNAIKRVNSALLDVRKMSIIRQYQESLFGLNINRSGGGSQRNYYHTLMKGYSDRDAINAWLFDYLNNDGFHTSKMFDPITAKQYISFVESNEIYEHEKIKPLYNLAKEVRKQEMIDHLKPVNWIGVSGLAAFNKNMSWLYCKGVKKLHSVVVSVKQNRIKFRTHCDSWMGVFFTINDRYSSHRFPKNWVMGDNGIIYPIAYANKKKIEIRGAVANSAALMIIGKAGDSNVIFSHSNGYYDSDKHCTYNRKLYAKDSMITTADGDKAPKDECKFVPRYELWYLTSKCVQIQSGEWELRAECIRYGENWFHRENTEFQDCRVCTEVSPVENFVYLDPDDHESGMLCSSCNSNLANRINRMCYSTDVIDHKGFGNSPLKINGERVYVGLELETYADYNDSCEKEIYRKLNTFAAGKQNYTVATRDGSLCGSHGIEYIFRPEGLLNQKRNVTHFIQSIGDCLVENAGDGYGLHIHVSDHFLTKLDKVKIDNFISMYEKYFRMIGGRGETEYQIRKKLSNNKGLINSENNKYKMVNIGRSGTIEYRFPKSLVDEVHICMNLELAQAVTFYCKYALSSIKLDTRSDKADALKGFIDYISDNKKQYPLLHAENSAKIKTNKLESYSEFCKNAIKAKKAKASTDESYTLAA